MNESIEFGYIKYELMGRVDFLPTQGGLYFAHVKGGCNFVKIANQMLPPPPPVLSGCSLISKTYSG